MPQQTMPVSTKRMDRKQIQKPYYLKTEFDKLGTYSILIIISLLYTHDYVPQSIRGTPSSRARRFFTHVAPGCDSYF